MISDVLKSDQVTVLMSTYNGERFLQQQLDSLYEQSYSDVKILVRDDGSSDTTREILEVARLNGSIEQLKEHHNMGIPHSFFTLLHHAARNGTAYVAFCDQDDVWDANKIERAVSVLHSSSDRPALYCSRVEIVNDQLQAIGLSAKPRKTGFGNALVENIAIGCTIVLNRKAIDLLTRQTLPDGVCLHDWWCYWVISCFGEIIFDDVALIKYRQHDANVVGAITSHMDMLKRKWNRLINGRLWISEQTVIFLQLFSESLPPAERELLESVCKAKSSFWHRISLAMSCAIWRQKWVDNFILRGLILINRI